MRYALFALVLIFGALQYRLWFGAGGVQDVQRLRHELADRQAELVRLEERNAALEAEVVDLKSGLDAIEERARSELGMIDEDETFYQFVRERGRRGAAARKPADAQRPGGDSTGVEPGPAAARPDVARPPESDGNRTDTAPSTNRPNEEGAVRSRDGAVLRPGADPAEAVPPVDSMPADTP